MLQLKEREQELKDFSLSQTDLQEAPRAPTDRKADPTTSSSRNTLARASCLHSAALRVAALLLIFAAALNLNVAVAGVQLAKALGTSDAALSRNYMDQLFWRDIFTVVISFILALGIMAYDLCCSDHSIITAASTRQTAHAIDASLIT